MIVDREKFQNSFDGLASFGLAISGMFYQAFNREKEDDLKVVINYEDANTGKIFDSTVYPDDLPDGTENE